MSVVARMALVALVIGASLSVAATERIDVPLVVSTSIGWSFVPVLQLLTGLILVRGVGDRTAALTAYFGTHAPWSLWILTVHALFLLVEPARDAALWIALTAIVPAALTVRALLLLCRRQFGLDRSVSARRVTIHQIVTYALVFLYVDFAIALWSRVA